MTPRQGLLLGLLTGLAVLGNVTAVPLFFSIHILLGSIASTLALLLLRGWWNVPITVLASLYTWKLWSQPWAIVIFSAEALWLALFVNRFSGPPQNDIKGKIILADIAFWLLVGTPLVFFFYDVVLANDPANVAVVAAKQVVNGIANTMGAFFLFVLVQVWRSRRGQGLLPLRGVVFSVVLASVLLPSMALSLLSGNLLQSATQEGVLENLQTVGEAAARITPLQYGTPSRALPSSVGSAAFLLIDTDGNRISSNPGLFLRLENSFQPAPAEQIKANGLQILIPRDHRPGLKVWSQGYWSTTQPSTRYLVQVVQPAAPLVMKLQSQSTTLLTTLLWMMLLGVLLSEVAASLVQRQLQILPQPLEAATEGPVPAASLERVAPNSLSSIAEVYELANRLQEQNTRVQRLSQDFTDVSSRLKQCTERQRRSRTFDLLTGATNRCELEQSLLQASERAQACSVPVACLAFSVQGLRSINAYHGRQKGDEVLTQLITAVKPLLRANDELFRIGGSEFLLLLWGQPLESARSTAELIRQVISQAELPPGDPSSPRLTMSAGVSLLDGTDTSGQELLSRVELALNQSRELGAHQVVVR
ncbi:GGDEF domain-containing protein [Cyanobium gracile]|uniref:GGDEF domain-containing protein n=1 Tax=Cyanobium gracile UHCC 0281 TaxID=3110309 RepID=A0ABU5SVS4_9CYAN|nr:GGDEF domain-containing protein [Cyanobium gracile]MEA5442445.1 GGDEF domain-containing protein [Cyanobium gracile UHCC 0281]